MNAEPKDAAAVDERHPWLGLASFTEETRAFFYGRDDEVAELARRVQRKLLTTLFGQSGLGKTSILRAGLVPRLRGHGYCPVYVRIAYSADAPEPGEQIKQAILATARQSGQWSQAGVAEAGESLWEFLHHRDDVLRDEAGNTLIPLLIFDQFEEIFTLAQTDEAGRTRAARFIDDLADLVENRPPRAFEAKLEADEALAERFDFARGDYRVLISLREDYLAPLESLKGKMPSLTQNRLRLAPMTGTQGLAAILGPGKGLVSQEVAEAIVRFVAGGSEIPNAEVEPSLLSLVCRELNDTRIAAGREEISLDLLAGSHDTILSNFYERALADQPPAVRRIIEDELLTESGYRENIAEETLQSHFAAAGAEPDTVATLVNRRLLRIEERLDMRRVELTHDVLTGVVKASRNLRHEREAREATERMLAEQQARAAAARHALVRARQVAAVCIVLALGAIGAAVFAYLASQRAKRAEDLAQQSRVQAETLLGYLTANFARELENSGRLDVIASLAKREIDYFHGLPEGLKGPETQRTAAQALVQYARASRRMGDLEAAWDASSEAIAILEKQRQAGEESEATITGLARALDVQALILENRRGADPLATSQRAADVIASLSDRVDASTAIREAACEVLTTLGYLQTSVSDPKSIATLERALQLAKGLGALEVKDTYVAALYTDAGAWLAVGYLNQGRYADTRIVAEEASRVADRILEQRPGDRIALYALTQMQQALGDSLVAELRPRDAIPPYLRAVAVQQTLVDFDPKNMIAQNNLTWAHSGTAEIYWSLGQVDDALEELEAAMPTARIAGQSGTGLRMAQLFFLMRAGGRIADAGRFAQVREIATEMAALAAGLKKREPAESNSAPLAELLKLQVDATTAVARGDARTALNISMDMNSRLQTLAANSEGDRISKFSLTYQADDVKSQAELSLKDFKAAEQSARAALASKEKWIIDPRSDERAKAKLTTNIALALVGQGKLAEARQVIEPVVKQHRELAGRNHGDQVQKVEMASALYAQALADPARRAALLREAQALLGSVPTPMKALHSTRVWSDRVRQAIG